MIVVAGLLTSSIFLGIMAHFKQEILALAMASARAFTSKITSLFKSRPKENNALTVLKAENAALRLAAENKALKEGLAKDD